MAAAAAAAQGESQQTYAVETEESPMPVAAAAAADESATLAAEQAIQGDGLHQDMEDLNLFCCFVYRYKRH